MGTCKYFSTALENDFQKLGYFPKRAHFQIRGHQLLHITFMAGFIQKYSTIVWDTTTEGFRNGAFQVQGLKVNRLDRGVVLCQLEHKGHQWRFSLPLFRSVSELRTQLSGHNGTVALTFSAVETAWLFVAVCQDVTLSFMHQQEKLVHLHSYPAMIKLHRWQLN